MHRLENTSLSESAPEPLESNSRLRIRVVFPASAFGIPFVYLVSLFMPTPEPRAYLPAFGGYCTLGTSNGYKDDMHPEALPLVDGKLYFNLRPHLHVYWEQQKAVRIERGEENWPELAYAPRHGRADARQAYGPLLLGRP